MGKIQRSVSEKTTASLHNETGRKPFSNQKSKKSKNSDKVEESKIEESEAQNAEESLAAKVSLFLKLEY